MKVTMLLADSAQAVNGKLYILGGGWSIRVPDPIPMAIAMKIEVPWDEANKRHTLKLALIDQDGRPVIVSTPTGDQPLEINADFEVGRPPGVKPGTPLDVPLAINIEAVPLPPDGVYVWRCSIDDRSAEDWRLTFTTRHAQKKGPHA